MVAKEKSEVPPELRSGLRNLGRTLSERDALKSFDRCIVGAEGCRQPAIDAHCIPSAALELIMNESKEVVGFDSTAPKNPAQWINDKHFKERSVKSFGASAWACHDHDTIFNPVDIKRIDVLNEHHLFLLVYKMVAYFTQRVLYSSERIATPALDPAFDGLAEFPDHIREGLKRTAGVMTHSAVRVLNIKWKMDKMLKEGISSEIAYRTTMWETTPNVAASGIKFLPGPSDRVEWYGGNSDIPVWIMLLPQVHGQTIITAFPAGTEKYTRTFHEGLSEVNGEVLQKGNGWTRMICGKVLFHASDVAVSHERFFQTTPHERDRLQEYICTRNIEDNRKLRRDLPNLLNIR